MFFPEVDQHFGVQAVTNSLGEPAQYNFGIKLV